MCAETDYLMGRVLDAANRTGHLDNTYVVFLSDHGEMNMEHRQVILGWSVWCVCFVAFYCVLCCALCAVRCVLCVVCCVFKRCYSSSFSSRAFALYYNFINKVLQYRFIMWSTSAITSQICCTNGVMSPPSALATPNPPPPPHHPFHRYGRIRCTKRPPASPS